MSKYGFELLRTQETLFISDLHLSIEHPEITKRFLNFLKNRACQAEKLYILGDLFDTWVGDDDYTPPTKTIRTALKQLCDHGTQVFLQPGNRDFLMGQRFCAETGVQLLGDYAAITLNGEATLLTHGDLLCTDDLPYQQFRQKSRSHEWQHYVLSKPLIIRLIAARWYRIRSFFHKRGKSQAIMDVNAITVTEVMLSHQTMRLIHGHTHRPAVHDLMLNGKPAQRFVLAPWSDAYAEVLCWDKQGYHIEAL